MSKYVVTNGRSYLRQLNRKGEYGLSPRTDATVWGTYKQALNALNNAISKDVKTLFYVEKANASTEIDVNKLIEADMSDFNRWISDIGNFSKICRRSQFREEKTYSRNAGYRPRIVRYTSLYRVQQIERISRLGSIQNDESISNSTT